MSLDEEQILCAFTFQERIISSLLHRCEATLRNIVFVNKSIQFIGVLFIDHT